MILKIILSCSILNVVWCISRHPILIVISYDAFRYNLFDTKLLPNMESLRKAGTYADYMVNIFPTKTFPNHFSIATGVFAETHGVIGASYFDAATQKVVKKGAEMFHYNEDVVPIWRWNEAQGDGRYSASFMWPGSDFPYQGKDITYNQKFTRNFTHVQKVDTVISWLTDPVKPANLVMLYVEGIDYPSHVYGSNSTQFIEELKKLDTLTKYIEDQLVKHNLSEKANVVHLSDHGILSVPVSKVINITQYMKPGTYTLLGSSPIFQIYPKKGFELELYNSLKEGSRKNGHFKVYRKRSFPRRWHYKNNTRTPDLLVMADVGYGLEDLIIDARKYGRRHNLTLTNSTEFGVHGYDNTVEAMRPFFMARGPRIKKQHQVPPFRSVDLYNLFTQILEIPKNPTNGSMWHIVDILRDSALQKETNENKNVS
ncbi:unnamed protein product [Diabrotica balteata]|uniref:Uncharacterized protein n=1 Tax=Diabrotica balteata TaxID=107213 RepID=A0A9N9T7X8_DIABA|nr:unnamed protein product [Diabrotica balteata]